MWLQLTMQGFEKGSPDDHAIAAVQVVGVFFATSFGALMVANAAPPQGPGDLSMFCIHHDAPAAPQTS